MPLEVPTLHLWVVPFVTFLFMTAWGIILIRAWDPIARISPLVIMMLPFMYTVVPKVATTLSSSMLALLSRQVGTIITLSTPGGIKEAHPSLVSRYAVSLVLSRSTESIL